MRFSSTERVQLIHEYDPKQYSMAIGVLPAAHPIVYQDFEMKLHHPTAIAMHARRNDSIKIETFFANKSEQ